jgi:hypothetical protein
MVDITVKLDKNTFDSIIKKGKCQGMILKDITSRHTAIVIVTGTNKQVAIKK